MDIDLGVQACGKQVCEALGLDVSITRSITIDIKPDDIVVYTVVSVLEKEKSDPLWDTFRHILNNEKYKLVKVEDDE